ncbi:AbrB family transcriptional regulator [Pararhodobacter zhoushanensis]|uniref:AbrB family transcriptional regulator n=1 Tax=Pararhodobacter zhoushanensis TaxID=2479545 RepID=UPI0013DE8BDF|nr:AbrB family transcriptional regulator [Pararhodobacter zhoushanensis]
MFNGKIPAVGVGSVLGAAGTLALALVGGIIAKLLHLPLAWLLGAVLATGLWSACGWRIAGTLPSVPGVSKAVAIPLLGVAIGSGFTPQIVEQMPSWWPTILGLLLYLPLVHWLCYRIFLLSPHISAPTAFYSAVPGGLVESVQMGEAAGGDVQMMTLLHLLRLIACVVFIPLGMGVMAGQGVSGTVATRPAGEFLLHHIPELLAVIGIGLLAGRILRLPAGYFFGPLMVSVIAHGAGWSTFVMPGWVIIFAQVVLGAGLGVRFAGMPRAKLGIALQSTLFTAAAIYAFAAVTSFVLGKISGISPYEIFLAYAPGGIAEMSLIAVAMNQNAIFVSCHHLLRIMFAIIGVRLLWRGRPFAPGIGESQKRDFG